MTSTLELKTGRTPKPYQTEASQQLASLSHALLAFTMGTGKTKIALNALTMRGVTHAVIVVKASLISHWKNESELEGHSPFVYHGSKKDKALEDFKTASNGVLLISFEGLVKNKDLIRKVIMAIVYGRKIPMSLIIDESHLLVNPRSNRIWSVWGISRLFTSIWLLTGTPIVNDVEDLFTTLSLLNLWKGKLSAYREEFMIQVDMIETRYGFTINIWEPQPDALIRLHQLLKPVMLTGDVEHLKPKVNTHELPFKETMELTKKLKWLALNWRKGNGNCLPSLTEWRLLSSSVTYEGKVTVRYNIINHLIRMKPEEQFFIVTSFETIAEELHTLLTEDGISSEVISGKVSFAKRDKIVKRMRDVGKPQVLIGVNQACREGLNLPFIKNLIWVDTAWNDSGEKQVRDRIRRVTSLFDSIDEYYLVASYTSEPWMSEIRAEKEALSLAFNEELSLYEI